jgi:predicted MFS family arabinose efflux permease
MLLALTAAFVMSQAFRTVAAIFAPPLQQEFHLSAQALGFFSGTFHLAFAALQFFMGMGIDVYGVRRTVLAVFPLAVAGALLSALAPRFEWLVFGQMLIGIGCAPAFLVCTVFIARYFPVTRFAALSGLTLGLGSVGMLLTGTPIAWLVQLSSWRAGFVALALCSALAWLAIWRLVREPASAAAPPAPSMGAALRSYGPLLRLPYTPGIMLMGFVGYASFISLRGLWLGPLLTQRHGLSLVQSGNVALLVSLTSLVSPPLFGRLDPGAAQRRRWIAVCGLVVALIFVAMACRPGVWLDAALSVAAGLFSGYGVLQYANVRDAYPAAMTGRAMAIFTMAMFLGVACMQWFTGAVASLAQTSGIEIFSAVFIAIAALLVLGTLGFVWLPKK